MAEEKDQFEKTEEPTPKRREDARKKGQLPRSPMLFVFAGLLAGGLGLWLAGGQMMHRLQRLFIGFLSLAGERGELIQEDMVALSLTSGFLLIPVILPLFAGITLSVVGVGLLQSSFLFTVEPLRPDFSRLNPVSGLRRLFSPDAAAQLVKSLLSVVLLATMGFFYVYSDMAALSSITDLALRDVLLYGSRKGIWLIGAAVVIMGALAGLDYLFQRWRTEVKLRMSRQEVKEEMREQEGDPMVKSRLKSLRQKAARQRMMADVAKADVVITNPQELAVALSYRLKGMAAPRVVGKGAGYVAAKIREVAREKGIPIVENKPLARLLFRMVEVGQEIPESLYRAVAEVLAYVYQLRRGRQAANSKWQMANNK